MNDDSGRAVSTPADNPLLDLSGLPRFGDIRPEHIEPALDELLAANRSAIEGLAAADGAPTWDSFAQPLEDIDERLARMWSPVTHLNAVMDSPDLREVYERCLPKLSDYHTEVGHDERLYRRYRELRAAPEFAGLDIARRRIVDNAVRDFRLSGVDLAPADKRRYREIQQELSTATNRFERNLLDATEAWTLHVTDPADLRGLPEPVLTMARDEAARRAVDGWVFTLHAPSYVPFLMHAHHRELRRRMYTAFVTRASDQGPHAGQYDNSDLMVRILRLRREEARLLGFPDYARYALETRMAESPQQISAFLHDLAVRARPYAEAELAAVRKLARESDGIEVLQAWDLPYYSERLRQRLFDFTAEDSRPYFPLPRVLQGMFEVVQRLYGVRVLRTDGVPVWHPDVHFFDIHDAGGEVRGRFYVDACARAGKRGGAWMDECIGRRRTADGVQVPVAYLTCNFLPPNAEHPSLLTHDDVTTLFHEFGHGLHHMLTRVDQVGVAGISGVEWDAIELPSQFMENWCWQRETIDLLSGHYQSGERLPEQLFAKMRAAMTFQAGLQMLRQVEFSLFDMRLHGDFEPASSADIQRVLEQVRAEVSVVPPPAFNRFQHGFAHIFAGGYAAGYYSYKWAEVLSADAFSRFEEEGIFNRATGESFLHSVLEQGGTRDAAELFVDFRGRPPAIDALLRHSGLAGPPPA